MYTHVRASVIPFCALMISFLTGIYYTFLDAERVSRAIIADAQ